MNQIRWIDIGPVLFLVATLIGCTRSVPRSDVPILLFDGTGTSNNDVRAIERLIQESGLEYTTADSSQLNEMSEMQLANYRLIVFPGDNYITMGDSLTAETMQRVRSRIEHGVNYLGICAGGLLAGKADCNSLDLTDGVKFNFYAAVNQNIHKAAVPIKSADSQVIEHYWEDGPQFTGWGEVVAKYPDDTPAIVEGAFGKGWVVLCGVHPEAPDSWRTKMKFSTTTGEANKHGQTIINAALNGERLAHY